MRYFNLYSNIFLTKGFNRVLISDLQRNVSELYPIEFYEIIIELNKTSIDELSLDFDSESHVILQEYIDILLKKEYGFITSKSKDFNFPQMSNLYNDPSAISNLFIELDDMSFLGKIKNSIENLGIKHLVIYCERKLDVDEIIKIDNIFFSSSIVGIEIYCLFHEVFNEKTMNLLHQKTFRINSFVFYNCSEKFLKIKGNFKFSLEFTKKLLVRLSCGKISLEYFETNISKVLESINHNTCLHKKISVDKNGNIKNCPSMVESFGNIKDTTLEEALNKPNFKKYWNTTKDQINVCKDCEFRHICTDCRAFTENPQDQYSKPLKCGYDPYTNKWEEWSTNPLKQKAIVFYGMQELIKNKNAAI